MASVKVFIKLKFTENLQNFPIVICNKQIIWALLQGNIATKINVKIPILILFPSSKNDIEL